MGMQRGVEVEMAETFPFMSLIENSLFLVPPRQGWSPLLRIFIMPSLSTCSSDQNSYEVTIWVLILLSLSPPLNCK